MIYFFNDKTKINMLYISLYKTYSIFFNLFYIKTCNPIHLKWSDTKKFIIFSLISIEVTQNIFFSTICRKNKQIWWMAMRMVQVARWKPWHQWDGCYGQQHWYRHKVECWRCKMQDSGDRHGLGSWLDTLREHRDVREICNSMDIIADMMVHVENI